MLCRLFSYQITLEFPKDWVPLIYRVANRFSFNWAQILFNTLAKYILHFHSNQTTTHNPPFYMSTYIMDSINLSLYFPSMDWKWTLSDPLPIHIYHSILWEENYFNRF